MTTFPDRLSYVFSLTLLFIAGALSLAFYSIAQTIVQRHLTITMLVYGLRAFSGSPWGCGGLDLLSLVAGTELDDIAGGHHGAVRLCRPRRVDRQFG